MAADPGKFPAKRNAYGKRKKRRKEKGRGGAGNQEAEHGGEHIGPKRIFCIGEQRVVE